MLAGITRVLYPQNNLDANHLSVAMHDAERLQNEDVTDASIAKARAIRDVLTSFRDHLSENNHRYDGAAMQISKVIWKLEEKFGIGLTFYGVSKVALSFSAFASLPTLADIGCRFVTACVRPSFGACLADTSPWAVGAAVVALVAIPLIFRRRLIPPKEVVVKTWELLRCDVTLVRLGDELKAEVRYPSREPFSLPIRIPDGRSIQQAIEHLTPLVPEVDSDNKEDHVRFARPAPNWHHELSRPGVFRSLLDPDVLIDQGHWSVTLADSIVSIGSNPKGWGGHAVILIEIVMSSIPFFYRAHLRSGGTVGIGHVEISQIDDFNPKWLASKTLTWLRSKKLVKQMIQSIDLEIEEEKWSPIHLDLRGYNSFGVDDSAHNCYTWARNKIEQAGICLYQDPEGILRPLVKMPKVHISLISLYAKECIRVQIEGANLVVDITREVDEVLGNAPWKLLTDANGEPLDITRVAGKINLKNYDKPVEELGTVEIQLFVQGRGQIKLDVTETVKQGIISEALNSMPMAAKKIDQLIVNHMTPEKVLKEQGDAKHYLHQWSGRIMLAGVGMLVGGAPISIFYGTTAIVAILETRASLRHMFGW